MNDSSFYAMAAVAIVGTMTGSYWLAGGEFNFSLGSDWLAAKPAFVSSVASTCQAGWKEGADNIDQMHCYLTNHVSRLCNPDEKNALFDQIALYDYDRLAPRREAIDRMQNAPRPVITKDSMKQAVDRIRHETKDQMAFESKKFEADQRVMFDSMADWTKHDGRNQYLRSQLLKDTTDLVAVGYLRPDDIDDRLPTWVSDAVTKAAQHSSGTPNPGCPAEKSS